MDVNFLTKRQKLQLAEQLLLETKKSIQELKDVCRGVSKNLTQISINLKELGNQ